MTHFDSSLLGTKLCSGCQTQEKVVAASAKTFVVIADYRLYHIIILGFKNYYFIFFSFLQQRVHLFRRKGTSNDIFHKEFIIIIICSGTEVCPLRSSHLHTNLSRSSWRNWEELQICEWPRTKQYVYCLQQEMCVRSVY